MSAIGLALLSAAFVPPLTRLLPTSTPTPSPLLLPPRVPSPPLACAAEPQKEAAAAEAAASSSSSDTAEEKDAEEFATEFDATLTALLADADARGSIDAALDNGWLEKLDEYFIPELGSRISAAEEVEADGIIDLARWTELMAALQKRSQQGFERARDQLQTLLGAGEINDLDRELSKLVKQGEVDAGLMYVILRNLQDAAESGDEGGARLLTHVYTRLQEELEKRQEPALALLHKLTRTDLPAVRTNILEFNLCEQKESLLPDGTKLPLNPPAAAKVKPMEFAAAISDAIERVISLPVERDAIDDTCEQIRDVAKEARAVLVDHYTQAEVDEFTEALTPAFARALPPKREVKEPEEGGSE